MNMGSLGLRLSAYRVKRFGKFGIARCRVKVARQPFHSSTTICLETTMTGYFGRN